MKTMRDLIFKNDQLEDQLNELKEIVVDLVSERSTSTFYDLLRFMPVTNMFIDVFGMFLIYELALFLQISLVFVFIERTRREKIEKRLNNVLKN